MVCGGGGGWESGAGDHGRRWRARLPKGNDSGFVALGFDEISLSLVDFVFEHVINDFL